MLLDMIHSTILTDRDLANILNRLIDATYPNIAAHTVTLQIFLKKCVESVHRNLLINTQFERKTIIIILLSVVTIILDIFDA